MTGVGLHQSLAAISREFAIDLTRAGCYISRSFVDRKAPESIMKVASSLKTLKSRDRNCQVVRRRGRLYVINKRNPRMKARQG